MEAIVIGETGRTRGLDKTQEDIVRETAEALAQTGERLERVIAALIALRREMSEIVWRPRQDGAPIGSHASALAQGLTKWRQLVEQAERFRQQLIIQREACGFRRHEDVDRHYPIPALPGLAPGTVPKEIP